MKAFLLYSLRKYVLYENKEASYEESHNGLGRPGISDFLRWNGCIFVIIPLLKYEQQAEYQQKNRNEQSGFLAGTIFLCLATLLLSILHRRAQNSDGPVRLSPKPLASSRSPNSPDSSPPVELEAFTLNSEAAAHLRLAKYEVDWNNFESAIREYDAALALDPDNPGIVSARNRVIERSKQAR